MTSIKTTVKSEPGVADLTHEQLDDQTSAAEQQVTETFRLAGFDAVPALIEQLTRENTPGPVANTGGADYRLVQAQQALATAKNRLRGLVLNASRSAIPAWLRRLLGI